MPTWPCHSAQPANCVPQPASLPKSVPALPRRRQGPNALPENNEKRAKENSAFRRWQGAARPFGGEEFIGLRNTAGYELAATLLADLGTIAGNCGEQESFARRLAELRARHERKGQFIKRLKDIGLVGSQAA